MPLVSIITVTYNAGKTLERTLQSVKAQTYPRIEHIIVDGVSTDNTVAIIQKYHSVSSNLSWTSEPDNGLYDAMNKGLQKANGDYVWFLNAGDTIHNATIVERLMGQLPAGEQPDIIYGETDIVDENGIFLAHRRLQAPEKLTWKSFKMGMMVSHQAFIVRRHVAPLYDLQYRFSSDVDWCIRCLKIARGIHNTHLILANYLNEGMTTANRKASLKERYRIMTHYYGWLPTALRHFWFFIRFYTAKIRGRQL